MSVRRLDVVKIGWLIWDMNWRAVAIGVSHARNMLQYDHSSKLENEFVKDVMVFHARPSDVVEKWRGAVLVFPDGTEEVMGAVLPGQRLAHLIANRKDS